jgi:hypothetical protein
MRGCNARWRVLSRSAQLKHVPPADREIDAQVLEGLFDVINQRYSRQRDERVNRGLGPVLSASGLAQGRHGY